MRNEFADLGWDGSDELVGLVEQWCNRTAGEEEVARLEGILRESPDARRFYRRYLNIHAELHRRCEFEGLGEGPAEVEDKVIRPQVTSWSKWAGWGVAAALTALLGVVLISENRMPAGDEPLIVEVAPDPTVGLMVSQSGARFTGEDDELPIRFGAGSYELLEGLVHLRMTNGVDVVLRGPTRFGIQDALRMTLESGIARVIVPESGQGFTIAAPEMDFEDLGTEFGLSVEGGRSEMHVFNGQVNAREPGAGPIVASVFGGESFVQNGGAPTVERSSPTVNFPSPENIGLESWLVRRPIDLLPEGLIAYFPFVFDAENPGVLKNLVQGRSGEHVVGDGIIEGARWVTGRWSGKDALLFDRMGDAVRMELPGEYEEISMSMWIDIERFDSAVTSFFTSDGWSEGDLHWQALRTQEPLLAVYQIPERGSLLQQPLRLRRWIHLAAVVSKLNGRTRYYVDGQLAQENELPADILITPGACRLGEWQQEDEDLFTQRTLHAEIDEFAIWDRALSEAEVIQLTRAGAPSLLTLADRLQPATRVQSGASFGTSKGQGGSTR